MKIRAHRALLAEAMETVKEIEPTKAEVIEYFLWLELMDSGLEQMFSMMRNVRPSDIEVKPYHYDSRIGYQRKFKAGKLGGRV